MAGGQAPFRRWFRAGSHVTFVHGVHGLKVGALDADAHSAPPAKARPHRGNPLALAASDPPIVRIAAPPRPRPIGPRSSPAREAPRTPPLRPRPLRSTAPRASQRRPCPRRARRRWRGAPRRRPGPRSRWRRRHSLGAPAPRAPRFPWRRIKKACWLGSCLGQTVGLLPAACYSSSGPMSAPEPLPIPAGRARRN